MKIKDRLWQESGTKLQVGESDQSSVIKFSETGFLSSTLDPSRFLRLSAVPSAKKKDGRYIVKMKVEPTMFLKTKAIENGMSEEPTMFMIIKGLFSLPHDVYET